MNRPVVQVISRDSLKQLADELYQLRREVDVLRRATTEDIPKRTPRPMSIARATAAGTALSVGGGGAITPGSVTADLYWRKSDGTLGVLETVTAYTTLPFAISDNTWLVVERDRQGDWWVTDVMPMAVQKTLLEDWRVGSGNAIEGKYCTFWAILPISGSWTSIHTGATCE